MSKIYKEAIELIDNNQLVKAINIEKSEKLEVTILLKLEYFNLAGSVKDRITKVNDR